MPPASESADSEPKARPKLFPGLRTLIDIGGQDAKIISLSESGRMSNFVMNDKCAAGTGRFLDVMANILRMDVDELDECASKSVKPASISSTCTVFAESEVISQLANGVERPDLVAGICESVASRVSALARRAGVRNYEKYVDATTLTDDEKIKEAVETYTVFGRVTPAQKKKFVVFLKQKGHTVAMTGDGVNDVLALKEADCSIAMAAGSDAARSVSQLVLLDSNFSSMPKVVAEGRRSINNIQRSSTLFIVKTIFSTILAILFLFLTAPFPFQPIQLTLVNACTIGIPSFILALEPNKERIKGIFILNILTIISK